MACTSEFLQTNLFCVCLANTTTSILSFVWQKCKINNTSLCKQTIWEKINHLIDHFISVAFLKLVWYEQLTNMCKFNCWTFDEQKKHMLYKSNKNKLFFFWKTLVIKLFLYELSPDFPIVHELLFINVFKHMIFAALFLLDAFIHIVVFKTLMIYSFLKTNIFAFDVRLRSLNETCETSNLHKIKNKKKKHQT